MEFDVIIIGAGPAGYTLAQICAKNGLKVGIIEREKIGGVCLNVGCIPTKFLLNIAETYSKIKNKELIGITTENILIDKNLINKKIIEITNNMIKGIEFLFKKYGIVFFKGEAKIENENTVSVNNKILKTNHIIIATGSRNKDYTFLLPNNKKIDNILTSTEAIFIDKIPKSITIIGGGAIGVEFAYIFSSFGTEVTILEYFPTLLYNMDEECGKTLERNFRKNKIKTILEAKVISISEEQNSIVTKYQKNGEEHNILSEYTLIAMGRTPNTESFNLSNLNVATKNAFILTNEFMQTTNPYIYAIGDVVSDSPLLAHVAYREAKIAAFHLLKKEKVPLNKNYIPFCIYTEPQVSGFGLTEDRAKSLNIDYKVVKSYYKSNGKANAINKTDGFIKILIEKEKIIGAWVIGYQATEIIHNLLLLCSNDLSVKNILNTIYAHPTISESIFEIIEENYG